MKEVSIEESLQAIQKMPKYQEIMKFYKVHLQNCDEISSKFNKNKWKEIIELEQMILSGVD